MTDYDFLTAARNELQAQLGSYDQPNVSPMKADRWIARSALQKAIRRGHTRIALAAMAALHAFDPRAMWRALVIVAIEDVGVGDLDTTVAVVATARSLAWRRKAGGDLLVAALLVERMARADHCQAVCDLTMRCANDPAYVRDRLELTEATSGALVGLLESTDEPLHRRALAALVLGGAIEGLGQDRDALFRTLERMAAPIAAATEAAWRSTREPMALLLAQVQAEYVRSGRRLASTTDDYVPEWRELSGVPTYALDQFTRAGKAIVRQVYLEDRVMQELLEEAYSSRSDRLPALGDALFLVEGTCIFRRAIWETADILRQPQRPLASTFVDQGLQRAIADRVAYNWPRIIDLRQRHILTSSFG